ncbi:MAG TPA: hypothetical protein VEX86_22035 [Longimicrobium sp.]|nr:hypothetical protein [Longimicrobium sp.]
MPRARAFARLLAAVALLVSWTTAGWAAACAQRASERADAPAHGHAMAHAGTHDGAHGAMHHPAPPAPAPEPEPGPPEPAGEVPPCPLLVMNGGSCLGAPQLPSAAPLPAFAPADMGGYPPADAIHDRLLPLSLFRPPEA